jgi:hypothetical protein
MRHLLHAVGGCKRERGAGPFAKRTSRLAAERGTHAGTHAALRPSSSNRYQRLPDRSQPLRLAVSARHDSPRREAASPLRAGTDTDGGAASGDDSAARAGGVPRAGRRRAAARTPVPGSPLKRKEAPAADPDVALLPGHPPALGLRGRVASAASGLDAVPPPPAAQRLKAEPGLSLLGPAPGLPRTASAPRLGLVGLDADVRLRLEATPPPPASSLRHARQHHPAALPAPHMLAPDAELGARHASHGASPVLTVMPLDVGLGLPLAGGTVGLAAPPSLSLAALLAAHARGEAPLSAATQRGQPWRPEPQRVAGDSPPLPLRVAAPPAAGGGAPRAHARAGKRHERGPAGDSEESAVSTYSAATQPEDDAASHSTATTHSSGLAASLGGLSCSPPAPPGLHLPHLLFTQQLAARHAAPGGAYRPGCQGGGGGGGGLLHAPPLLLPVPGTSLALPLVHLQPPLDARHAAELLRPELPRAELAPHKLSRIEGPAQQQAMEVEDVRLPDTGAAHLTAAPLQWVGGGLLSLAAAAGLDTAPGAAAGAQQKAILLQAARAQGPRSRGSSSSEAC